jgi:serine/threonine-protein kinase
LLRVQQGRANSFTFTQGSLKGQIVQQNCGFIYISIWEADLHNFNVSSSRKC